MTRKEALALFRDLAIEQDTEVVPDPLLDSFLQGGLEATNDLLEYVDADDSSALSLVAEQSTYVLPADCAKVRWIDWNGKFLDKTSMDELRKRKENWRQTPSGAPREYLLSGRNVTLNPPPSQDAVLTAPTGTIRYVGSPASFRTKQFQGLITQHHRIPVFYAVAHFLLTVNRDFQGYQAYMSLFEARAKVAAAYYRDRAVGTP